MKYILSLKSTLFLNNVNMPTTFFYCKLPRKSFSCNLPTAYEECRNYKEMAHFPFQNEIFKFYPRYLNNGNGNPEKKDYTKQEYIDLYNRKANHLINLSYPTINIPSGNKFKFKFEPIKHEILQLIHEKIVYPKNKIPLHNLHDVSSYIFKQQGKMIRPYLLILFGRYLFECKYGISSSYLSSQVYQNSILPFAVCLEATHTASLLHDDIIDNSNKRRNSQTSHLKFGISNTVFGANYIMSQVIAWMSLLRPFQLNQIFSTIVYNLAYGEINQTLYSKGLSNLESYFQSYMTKTYYKTASLLALGLQGIGVILDLSETLQKKLFEIGLHIGMVFQIVDDVLDVCGDSALLKKPAMKDIREGLVNAHVLFEIDDDSYDSLHVRDMARRRFKSDGDIDNIMKILNHGKGIVKAQNLAMDHLLECVKIMDDPFLLDTPSKHSLLKSFNFLIKRNC